MPSLINNILPLLEAHRLPELDIGENIIYPHYKGYSICNLPSSICNWLGVPPFDTPLLSKTLLDTSSVSIKNVVLIIIDGLGFDWFLRFCKSGDENFPGIYAWDYILSEGTLAPLTSVVPSTTSTALTTLWTGCTPLEHGILGYEIWLKEYGILANMITHTPVSYIGDVGGLVKAGFHPDNFLPVSTMGHHLAAYGIQSYAFLHHSIANSGLSAMHLLETNVIPYQNLSDLWVTLYNLLNTKRSTSSYTYIYYADIDSLSHRFGPDDERVFLEFSSFSLLLQRFIKKLHKKKCRDTLIIVTADHGFIPTSTNSNYELINHPRLLENLVMVPSGENRLPYLFVRNGQELFVQAYIQKTWHGEFQIMPVEKVLNSGLFGDGIISSAIKSRLGDFIVFPRQNAYWWWANKENTLLGRHGGLSHQEMLVPLIKIVL